jgi:lipoprotein-releasing system ATP-binding protein
MSEFVDVRGLCKSYPSGRERLDVLNGLELRVARGHMVAVTGASGSGKSTFLHLVGGMDRPDSGSVVVGGQELTTLSRSQLAEFRNRQIGFVFQFHHLLPEFSALENVMFPLLLRRTPPGEAAELAAEMLQEVGLRDRLQHRPGELSGGEQQRVAIARALVGSPSLLLADEPTGNLDVATAEAVYHLLLEVHARHQLTSIMVTHNLRLAAICDSQWKMETGRLTPAGAAG